MTHLRVGVATFAVLAAAACASAGQHTGDSSGGGDESVITATELRAAPVTNLFDYIRAHRPRWLQRNYSLSFHETQVQNVVVFLDDHEHGGPETLQTFSTTAAAEVRYYTPSEAEAHFGVGFGNGVIQVVSRTR